MAELDAWNIIVPLTDVLSRYGMYSDEIRIAVRLYVNRELGEYRDATLTFLDAIDRIDNA